VANPAGKLGWKIVNAAVAAPIGIAAAKGVSAIWSGLRPDDPPRDPSDSDARLTDILGWATVSAVGMAIGQIAANRGAKTVWRGLTGTEPPAPKRK